MDILTEIHNHVAFVTLNRPAALNALSFGMVADLRTVLRGFAMDDLVRAVLIQGAGGKAFCAGGDLRALYESVQHSGSLHHEFFAAEYPLDYLLHTYPKPCVAVMDGITMGGGMGIAQGSRLRVVGERTRIAMPEVGIGLFPDVGGSFFLSRLPGALGYYLALTGMQIRGADALYSRLADVYLTPEAVASLPRRLRELRWSDAPWTVDAPWRDGAPRTDGATRRVDAPWRDGAPRGDGAPRRVEARWTDVRSLLDSLAAQDLAATSLSLVRPAIDTHFSHASVPAILESLDTEIRPEFAGWAATTAKLMRTRSPTMLCVALRQLQRGRTMSLAECLRMELGMVRHCMAQNDFLEGVRALIIDKDNAPKWVPSRLEDVNEASVEAYFQDPWVGGIHPLADLERSALHG
jgi:enoyl-CoA hydratase/carnithine racemase